MTRLAALAPVVLTIVVAAIVVALVVVAAVLVAAAASAVVADRRDGHARGTNALRPPGPAGATPGLDRDWDRVQHDVLAEQQHDVLAEQQHHRADPPATPMSITAGWAHRLHEAFLAQQELWQRYVAHQMPWLERDKHVRR